jgi:hypothetical protein
MVLRSRNPENYDSKLHRHKKISSLELQICFSTTKSPNLTYLEVL